jgi:hypothetical protein
VPHRRPEAIFGKLKVFQSAAHEDPGCMYGMRERRFSINQKYLKTLRRQQTRAL